MYLQIPVKIFSIFCGFLLSFQLFGKEVIIDIEVEQTDEKGVVEKAIKKLSYELMTDILESSRIKEKKKEINRIITQKSNRYILYTKKGIKRQKEGSKSFVIPVTIGFSTENLKHILVEEEIFYSNSFHTRVLPVILLEDRVDRELYGWWMNSHKIKKSVMWQSNMSNFYNQLQSELMPYGFYLVNPEFAGIRYFIPEKFEFKLPKKKSVFNLAKYLTAYLVLIGSIRIKEIDDETIFSVKADLTIYHAKNGRILAEIERTETVTLSEENKYLENENQYKKSHHIFSEFLKKQKGFFRGLGMQMGALYKAGQISSNLLRITVQGELSYRHFESFKNQLISKVASIKDLKENIIRSRSITYLASTNNNITKITPLILKTKFSGFNVKVKSESKREIKLDVYLK